MIMTLLQSNRNQQLVSDTMDVGVSGTEPTSVQLTPPPSSPSPAQPSLPISPAQPSLPISPPVPMGPPQAPVLPDGPARKPRNKFRRGTEGKGEAIPQVPAGGSVTLVQKLRSRSRKIAIVKSRLMEMECQRLQYLGNKLSGTSLIENEKMNIFHVSNQVHRFSASSSFKLLDNGALTDDQDRLKAIIQAILLELFQERSIAGG
ncbi:hypothetical protein quinque_009790 [Culex quinquefasciatus]